MPGQRTSPPKRQAGPEVRAFGRALAAIRAERGFNSDYHPKYISLLERGLYSPSLTAIVRLSGALHMAPSELIRRMEVLLPKRPKDAGPGR